MQYLTVNGMLSLQANVEVYALGAVGTREANTCCKVQYILYSTVLVYLGIRMRPTRENCRGNSAIIRVRKQEQSLS